MLSQSGTLNAPLLEDRSDRPVEGGTGPSGLSVRQVIKIIRRHELLLGAIMFFTVLIVLLIQLTATPVYQATATVQVELNDDSGSPDLAARNQQRVANEAGIYRSRSLAERVVQDLKLAYDPRFNETPLPTSAILDNRRLQRLAGRLMSSTSITSLKESDFIEITVRSTSPDLASEIANQFPASLAAHRSVMRDDRQTKIVRQLDDERARLATEAHEAERAVADFRRQHQLLTGAGGAEDYAQINRIAAEAASAAAMRAAQSARAAGVAQAVGNITTVGATSPLLDQQRRQLDDLTRTRSELAMMYGSEHPKMRGLEAQISETSTSMRQEQARVLAAAATQAQAQAAREAGMARSEAASAASRAGQLEGTLRSITGKAFANTAATVELNALERNAEAARSAFAAMSTRAEEVKTSLAASGIHSRLMSPAAVPQDPISPRPKSATFAAFAGSLILGLLIVFGIELTDNRLWNAEQIYHQFGLRTFAMLPELAGDALTSAKANPVLQDPQSLFAEVARGLGSEVAEIAQPGKAQTVLITSPITGDGKSTVTLTLLAAAVAMGRRAIVIDLDLRRPSDEMRRSTDDSDGRPDLVDYLTGAVDARHMLPAPLRPQLPGSAESPGVTAVEPVVLSAREPARNPVALMRLGRVNELLDHLREQYDLMIINAPPTLATRDSRMLMKAADHTLLVVRWGRTTIEQVRAALQVLQKPVDGVVINRVDYAEHARRGYGDPVQFYMDSAEYFDGEMPTRRRWYERVTSFRWRDRADHMA
ncbi:Succinoglycan biosynthesis protein ExoP [Sphingobium herbicidovorans NBRC 16415]|uniref:Succinoglycan biosynthesis protein ExoP n=1 Tax=Sphingobium herbicidovorans (strain ATCC 700291 / DSM 11019 / CCUG 56400 / KCTC 2939 / LMG 18315 / NBRC 16415 / MH) TaxID=1219045 RepID=A0A086PAM6_SPHHM|nr:Wzz/FepE/Etk N-terminal domain-containing protein [Sphingobium herbicidovorans]KFG90444.1 Succinoglycan biosynthesis protein ExoP [Sphingobium herbicidovorans NBRC 16415]